MLVAAFTWTEFAQQIAAGVRQGAVFAGLALALVIIYRSTRAINFAQGEMATFTTFIAWSLMNNGLSFWTAFPIVLAIAFVGGVAIERVIIRPVENGPVITIVIVTLGLALLLNGLMSVIWGGGNRPFNGPFSTRTNRRRRRPDQRAGHRDRRRLVRARRATRALLPLHQARARHAGSRVEPGLVGARRCASGWMLASAGVSRPCSARSPG
jgi:hypothetical protein